MAHRLFHLGGGDHSGLFVEKSLKFGVVDAGIPGGDDQHRLPLHPEGEGLGDLTGRAADGSGGLLDGGAGLLKMQHAVGELVL